jgi:hypothetical protein
MSPLGGRAAAPATCLYVYGLIESDTRPISVTGGPGRPGLELTTVGRVAAVHCEIDPADLDDVDADIAEGSTLATLVRRHDDVVKALAAAGPVLPVRLGTLLPDRESLARVLRAGEPSIAAALARVRGKAEWNLRVMWVEPAGEAGASVATAPGGGGGAGTTYLLGRREARRATAQQRDKVRQSVAAVESALARLADDSTAFGAAASTICSCAYLVAQPKHEQFLAAAEQGVAELEGLGCTATVRGPLPAYSFVDVRLEGIRHG